MNFKRIGILGAMPEEIEPLLEVFGSHEVYEYAQNTYYKVSYKGLEVVVAYSRIGKVFSTLSATALVVHFGCEAILFSGVAGGINPDLKIGDLIVATELCQHDLDITAFGHPHGFVPGGKVFTPTNSSLNDLALKVAASNDIKLTKGKVATGDQFVASSTQKDFISKTFGADALEMEGASVACVCDALQVPCLILRSISDSAGEEANVDFDEFLKHSCLQSASFMCKILDELA